MFNHYESIAEANKILNMIMIEITRFIKDIKN